MPLGRRSKGVFPLGTWPFVTLIVLLLANLQHVAADTLLARCGSNDCGLYKDQFGALHRSPNCSLSCITTLDLSNYALTSLTAGVFDGLSSMTALALQENQLTSLPAGVFDGLSSLQHLNLNDNRLLSLPDGIFSGLSVLQELYFRQNQLVSLPDGVFNGLSLLRFLSIRGNPLTSLPDGACSGLSALQELYIYETQLTVLPARVFEGLRSLRLLHLYTNSLTSLPDGVFDDLSSVQEIKLQENKLSTLPAGVLNGLASLQDININDNQITSLQAGVFDGLLSLQKLYLRRNQLTNLPDGVFDRLTSLLILSIRGNPLTTLPDGVFDELTSLQELYIYNTQLEALPDGVFDQLSSLQKLETDISRCPAGTFTDGAWEETLQGWREAECKACGAGTSSAAKGATSSSTCAACPAGTYAMSGGASACTSCAVSSICSGSGTAVDVSLIVIAFLVVAAVVAVVVAAILLVRRRKTVAASQSLLSEEERRVLMQTAGSHGRSVGGSPLSKFDEVCALKTGHPAEAASGLEARMCVGADHAEARKLYNDRRARDVEGVEEEVRELVARFEGSEEAGEARQVLELLQYILHQGTSEKEYANGIRDRGRPSGTTLEYFVLHPNARQAGLSRVEVVALRLYTTMAFKFMNSPLRDDGRAARGEPCLLAVTTYFAEQGIKKLRKLNAPEIKRQLSLGQV
eukprot:CAMPEP_0114112854 /NCGR_PEP_ID=MMETSP0043_2-20121206/2603_1 /TAXON_ID=464988 /ORGANISM="Hemiselmis andersenii, Strain CCMP644" /LENGTH=689 /DNA_ID=CAMNT_0001204969 /DNA_START=9 /DNA_END=2074 /DNA_ORIENTATION=+